MNETWTFQTSRGVVVISHGPTLQPWGWECQDDQRYFIGGGKTEEEAIVSCAKAIRDNTMVYSVSLTRTVCSACARSSTEDAMVKVMAELQTGKPG